MTAGAAAVSGGAKKKPISRATYVKRAKALGVKGTSEKNMDQLKAAIYRKKAAKKAKKPARKTATKGKKKTATKGKKKSATKAKRK